MAGADGPGGGARRAGRRGPAGRGWKGRGRKSRASLRALTPGALREAPQKPRDPRAPPQTRGSGNLDAVGFEV
ncbi:hypothetical protein GCM10010471_06220 [Leucobacter komagatae]